MREILFRGKRVDTGEWVYGAYCHYDDIEDNGKDDCDYIIQKHNGEHFPFVKVIPSTIGQYTGLTDKNGKKIFQGDIIKYTRTKWNEPLHSDNWKDIVSFHEIYFDENEGSFKQKHYTDKGNLIASGYMSSFVDVRADENKIEVIGNVYDNPELLEEK